MFAALNKAVATSVDYARLGRPWTLLLAEQNRSINVSEITGEPALLKLYTKWARLRERSRTG